MKTSRMKKIAPLAMIAGLGLCASAQAAVFLQFTSGTLNGTAIPDTDAGPRMNAILNGLANGDAIVLNSSFISTTNPAQYSGNVVWTINVTQTAAAPVGTSGKLTINPTFLSPESINSGSLAVPFGTLSFGINIDFSGLSGAVLPTGSSLFLNDFDGGSRITNFRANAGAITTAFFDPQIDTDRSGAATPTGQPNPGPSDYATTLFTSPSYSITAASTATDNPASEFVTNQTVSSFNYDYYSPRGIGNSIQFSDIPLTSIPEASSALLLLGGIVGLGARRKR
jgi:hypothetical protein